MLEDQAEAGGAAAERLGALLACARDGGLDLVERQIVVLQHGCSPGTPALRPWVIPCTRSMILHLLIYIMCYVMHILVTQRNEYGRHLRPARVRPRPRSRQFLGRRQGLKPDPLGCLEA